MLRANPKKTKSALKKSSILVVGVLLLLCAAVFIYRQELTPEVSRWCTPGGPANPLDDMGDTLVKLNGQTYCLETVTGPEEQARGLGGRDRLAANTGMHFIYAVDGKTVERCIWMKDMKIAIDIVWVSREGRIVKIAPNVSPNTYPQTFCAFSQDVFELPAGATVRDGITVGQRVEYL